jgi:hypothetical protein
MPSNIIRNAAAATSAVLEHAAKAELLISHVTAGSGVNGFGVFSDPAACRTQLRAAEDEIEMALGIIAVTSWPTDADYSS